MTTTESDDRPWIDTWLIDMLSVQNYIVNGGFGGFIVGPSHEQGGINFIRGPFEKGYLVCGNMEGFEFIMNHGSSEKYRDRIFEINDLMDDLMESHTVDSLWDAFKLTHPNVIHIDTFIEDNIYGLSSKMLLFNGDQLIVNKYSTLKYFEELYEMNLEFKPKIR